MFFVIFIDVWSMLSKWLILIINLIFVIGKLIEFNIIVSIMRLIFGIFVVLILVSIVVNIIVIRVFSDRLMLYICVIKIVVIFCIIVVLFMLMVVFNGWIKLLMDSGIWRFFWVIFIEIGSVVLLFDVLNLIVMVGVKFLKNLIGLCLVIRVIDFLYVMIEWINSVSMIIIMYSFIVLIVF